MATIRKSITFTTQQEDWIKHQLQKGLYTNESEYIRDLIRNDQKNYLKQKQLEKAIHEGLQSGVSNHSILDIMDEINHIG
ncbi:type II toxin-antitoxin system ParD family antitoxin [Mesohalobacter halotolerans]|jgi:antitoxin ParD1/3/4|uniref:Type II toxin-antitoxin system ParD family antitoxin n=1 Tax=Mesohalobacter halotolerans TaxID=1883405 RepID=A0A4U5TUG6_9FLAO|nr:type II toxin-antitoxin system ParD family antitoxin [Mesohalobacter halotolerans]MBS3738704.1 type II toxin-antitoxin system ParD family antitoxin [Psychroflexus sp.]NBC58760.1 type II toxin-antitoxin system ParD family antitoxin [Bacteroidota bacterium]TKS56938.1 type II toxin-antitoxin system ParD family antitoxin [Mesohalobacter halotolerans]